MNEKIYKIANVRDDYTLVLAAGKNNGIKKNFRFLIYSIGEEIFDPDSGESLGRLEIVKGTGIVTHVQDKICTLESDMYSKPKDIITKRTPAMRGLLGDGFSEITTEKSDQYLIAFRDVSKGDYAKYIG